MPQRLRDERDRRALVDGVTGMGMTQPVSGDRRRLIPARFAVAFTM